MDRKGWTARRLAPLFVVAAVLAALPLLTRRARDRPQPRLVLLYAPCTVNRLFLSPYDPSVRYTPFLSAFAEGGLVFTKHQSEAGISGVSYAALFSGDQVMRHGVYSHPERLRDSVYLIAEAYRDNGYDTFFWAAHPMASPEFNYAQGVKHVIWTPHERSQSQPQSFLRAEDPRFRQVLARLRDDPTYKAFIMTNFTVTHVPYRDDHVDELCRDVPSECAGLSADEIDHYKKLLYSHFWKLQFDFDSTVSALELSPAEIAELTRVTQLLYTSNVHYLDRLFGAVVGQIESAGLLDQSLIAFTADHGEVLRRKNAPLRWTHGYMLSNEEIVVPLILRGPGVPAGRYTSVTRSIDVFPTLAGLSGIEIPPGAVSGVNLARAIRGEERPPKLLAFSHTALVPKEMKVSFLPFAKMFPAAGPSSMWVAVREDNLVFKITSDDRGAFGAHVYDWEADPSETRDLFDPNDPHHTAMVQRLNRYKTEIVEAYGSSPRVARRRTLTGRQKELLRALGYLPDDRSER
jgi:arylsulfatase A-like enzyme